MSKHATLTVELHKPVRDDPLLGNVLIMGVSGPQTRLHRADLHYMLCRSAPTAVLNMLCKRPSEAAWVW